MLGPMSGRRAKLPGSTKDANSLGPRHNRVEVLPQSTLRSFDSCDSVARPGRPANALCQGLGPDFFFPTSSVGLARAERICAGCPVAAECLAVALDDLSLHGIWAARPNGSVNICEVKKDWAGDEPARSMRRRDLVSRKGSALVSSVLAGDPGLVGPSNSV